MVDLSPEVEAGLELWGEVIRTLLDHAYVFERATLLDSKGGTWDETPRATAARELASRVLNSTGLPVPTGFCDPRGTEGQDDA